MNHGLRAFGVMLVAGIVLAGSQASAAGPNEARSLEDLFTLTSEAATLNSRVMRWFLSEGSEGMHAADYLSRIDDLRDRIAEMEMPVRLESVRRYVAESLSLQRGFLAEWFEAHQAGHAFASQLTDEYAYHEGLHRSHRLLLKAYAELRSLFPDADAAAQSAFRNHMHAMDLI